jgi:hypothetical protein
MRSSIRAFRAIALHAFKEGIRERTLYNLFFVTLLMLGAGYLAALLVFGHQERVLLHFGLMVNSLSIFAVAASAGVRTLRAELEQRTAYLILARPVSRSVFYIGKWAGLVVFLSLNLSLLMLILTGALYYIGGHITFTFFQAAVLMLAEASMVAALALALSLVFRPGISAMMTFSYLFLSHNHEQLEYLRQKGAGGLLPIFLEATPDAQAWLMDTRVYYEQPLQFGEWMLRAGYGLGWALVFLFLGNAFFYRKNL